MLRKEILLETLSFPFPSPRSAQVVTTVDTMTVPLTEVYFPSVVVCNINQANKKQK